MPQFSRSAAILFVLCAASAPLAAQDHAPSTASSAEPARPSILLVDDSVHPEVIIRWDSTSGPVEHRATYAYTAPVGGEPIAPNLLGYACVGGTRVETGAGHPKGLVLRVGLTKEAAAKPLFEDIAPGSFIEIEMRSVRVQQPVQVHQGTGLMHLKYALRDLEACSIPGTARNQYLLEDPKDTLGGRVIDGTNATPGALSGDEGMGTITTSVSGEDHDRIDIRVSVPYGMLRHLLDPWESDLPNTFFEPIHFHTEVELLPIDAEPFDRVWETETNEPAEEPDNPEPAMPED